MSERPTLVILAAGMGSRFGGLKQITAVDDLGHAIIDFSLYDAYMAGFRDVVFLIKREIEGDFRRFIGQRMERYFNVKYVYQQLDMLPEGYQVPEGRSKPWGTGHAVLCCKDHIQGPFAVINADDFYGRSAYTALYQFLSGQRQPGEQAMVAYMLKNTLTDNGSVARGICQVEDGYLTGVVERTKILRDGDGAKYTEDGESFFPLDPEVDVSLNCWAFGPEMLQTLEDRFAPWLDKALEADPIKGEFFLPFVVNDMIAAGEGKVRVMQSRENWYGVTYKEDMAGVKAAIEDMRSRGLYPPVMLD